MNLKIDFLYKATHPESHSIPMHLHNCYEIVYYCTGKGTVVAGGQRFHYSNGSVVLVTPNTLHDERGEASGDNIVIGFTVTDESFLLKTGIFFADAKKRKLFEEALVEFSNGDAFYNYIAEAKLCELVCLIMREESVQKEENFLNILKNVENYLDENMSLPLRLSDFAETYHYSGSRFRHLFTEKAGISLKRYVMKKRFERARELLVKTKKSITEIALECGFYDSAQFARLFKKENGCTPKQYRELISKR